jgi:hypothetical protein
VDSNHQRSTIKVRYWDKVDIKKCPLMTQSGHRLSHTRPFQSARLTRYDALS